MQINRVLEATKLTITPVGRIDTITSPELESAVADLAGVEELVFDLAGVDYVSSAGLRVLLASQRKMAGKKMVISGTRPAVKEVFDITGFSDIFTFA